MLHYLAPYSGNCAPMVALWNCHTLSLEVETKRKSSAARSKISVCPLGGRRKAERWKAVRLPLKMLDMYGERGSPWTRPRPLRW